MKKKKFKIERLLKGASDSKNFKICITEQFATLSTISGNWRVSYQTGTRAYMWILFCLTEGFNDALYEFTTLSYGLDVCTYSIKDEKFGHPIGVVKKALKSVLDQMEKENPPVEISKEEDDEILKQEKLKHDNN